MNSRLRTHVAAMMLLAPMAATFVASPAAAQQRAVVATPAISTVAFNSDAGLSPGATLRINLKATPGARSPHVVLGDSGVRVNLRERTRGNYVGTHVVRRSDRIDPTQLMTARLTYGKRTIVRSVSYPPAFQALAMGSAPVAVAPQIERFVVRPASGRIEPGSELRFRLHGQPGANAWVDIPGVNRPVALEEVRPGVYQGNYTVRQRDNPDAFERAVATLQAGQLRSTERVTIRGERDDDDRFGADRRGPQVTDITPSNGERMGPRGAVVVSARLSDDISGVDPASVRLRINGEDVTRDARIDADSVRFREDLRPGRHTAEIVARDRAGNSTRTAWSFDVVERQGRNDRDLPLRVTSLSDNAVVDANGNLSIEGRTAPGATVRVQVESVANLAGVLGLSQPVADQTVRADRNGFFSLQVRPATLIPGSRFDIRLTANDGARTAEERLSVRQG